MTICARIYTITCLLSFMSDREPMQRQQRASHQTTVSQAHSESGINKT